MRLDGPQFTWDPEKDRANRRKRGVDFAEASTVFNDEDAKLIDDPGHSDQEDRFVILGLSAKFRILVVCHGYRQSDDEIRIISARKATKLEARHYEG